MALSTDKPTRDVGQEEQTDNWKSIGELARRLAERRK